MTTPDAIEPIRAYRAWVVKGNGELRSTSYSTTWERDMTADCTRGKGEVRIRIVISKAGQVTSSNLMESIEHDVPHEAPSEYCACGLYACNKIEWVKHCNTHLWLRQGDVDFDLGNGVAVGVVELSGRIFAYERGYRAQYAKIVGLYHSAAAERAAKRYGIALLKPPADLARHCNCAACESMYRMMNAHGKASSDSARGYSFTRWPPPGRAIDIAPKSILSMIRKAMGGGES